MKTPIRVLHLEDSPRDAQLIQDKLEADGLVCDIVRVDNREPFEAALAENSFDLILCDYDLPDYDGLSALKLAREKHPVTPVLLISGVVREEEAVKCLHLGATDYLLKQRLKRLPAAVERALQEAEEHRKRREAEEMLRLNSEIMANLAEGVYLVRASDGVILHANPQFARMFGYGPGELTGKHVSVVYAHSDKSPEERAGEINAALKANPPWKGEIKNVKKDGTPFWCHATVSTFEHKTHGTVWLSSHQDITARKQIEAQLLRMQRLESIGTLAGGVAHDLNNALAPILMGVEILRMQYPDATNLIDTMESSARRGADMVRQLLTFAKGVEGARLLIQPLHLLKEIEKIIKATFPKNIQLRMNCAPKLQMILGDATQLHQVLLNLCVNARDALPNGGTLTLEAENEEIDATYASAVPEAKPGSYVVWRVKDTGTGIPPEILERIFEPFFSTKGPDKGTGLGLSTVSGIVKSHGGFVRVYSTPGQGTTFAVYLPAAGSSIADMASLIKAETTFHGNGETILVVDDEAAVRQVTRTVLTALNFKVLTASDGTAALMEVAEKRAELRAVITDVHMPHMDGLTFVRVLKHMLPEVGIIVASGRLDEREASEFKTLGVAARLDKPFNQEKLVEALKTVFQK